MTFSAIAELRAPSRVACSDLLAHVFILCSTKNPNVLPQPCLQSSRHHAQNRAKPQRRCHVLAARRDETKIDGPKFPASDGLVRSAHPKRTRRKVERWNREAAPE